MRISDWSSDVCSSDLDVAAEVRRLAGEVWTKLALPGAFPADKVILEPGYAGAAYGLPTTAMKDAVQRTAQLEGLLLDPVYSGKAMAAIGRASCRDRVCQYV